MGHLDKLAEVINEIINYQYPAGVTDKAAEYQHPGKKALQKLIYLMERNGVDLGFNYSIHYYGPYSSVLDDAIRALQIQDIVEIKQDNMSQRIYLRQNGDNSFTELSEEEKRKLEEVLHVFGCKKPAELELITTTDFVARELCQSSEGCEDDEIVKGVKKIKGDKFTYSEILQAISELRKNGYI